LRVLLTTHQFFPEFSSGTEVLTLGVARELIARGIEVCILTGFPGDKSGENIGRMDRYEYEGLQVYRFFHAFRIMPGQKSRVEGDFDNRLAAAYFREIASAFKPDLVHCFHLHRLGTGIIAEAVAAGIPVFFTPTDFWALCPTGQLMDLAGAACAGPSRNAGNCIVHLAANRLGMATGAWLSSLPDVIGSLAVAAAKSGLLPERAGAGEIISVSERKDLIVSRLNQVERIVVPTRMMERLLIGHGVDACRISYSAFGMECHSPARRRERSGPGFPLRVGYIGTLAPHKGCHVLVEAFNGLEDGAATLRIYGRETDFPDYARELRRIANGNRRIEFPGGFPNERIGEVIADLDVMVVPSLWQENSPLVIYSAQAFGCPVIGSDVEGIVEVVRDGVDGLIFRRGDAEALRGKLRLTIDEPQLLGMLSARAPSPKTMIAYVNELTAIWMESLDAGSSNASDGFHNSTG
jgi:glycosyltransferase involved in cell wall biosynthesis